MFPASRYIGAILLLVVALTCAGQVKTKKQAYSYWDSLPNPVGWVNDFEGLFTNKQKQHLDSIIENFKRETEIEIAIVTVDSSATSRERFDSLTLYMANKWGVGQAGKDNGILIGISKGHKKIRIQNGYVIEKLISDDETKMIIANYFLPAFKSGNYYTGTRDGLIKLIDLLKLKLTGKPHVT
jgi:uncharacterized protein